MLSWNCALFLPLSQLGNLRNSFATNPMILRTSRHKTGYIIAVRYHHVSVRGGVYCTKSGEKLQLGNTFQIFIQDGSFSALTSFPNSTGTGCCWWRNPNITFWERSRWRMKENENEANFEHDAGAEDQCKLLLDKFSNSSSEFTR